VTKNDFYDCVIEAYRPAETLIKMVPSDKLEWRPKPDFMSLGQLIQHLGDGVGLPLRCLVADEWPISDPAQMADAMKLENLPSCDVDGALRKLDDDKRVLAAPWGVQGKMERMAIYFLEHFTNHKMQLFTYLKLLGFPVDTSTLYFG
jgi:hypothetical protein